MKRIKREEEKSGKKFASRARADRDRVLLQKLLLQSTQK